MGKEPRGCAMGGMVRLGRTDLAVHAHGGEGSVGLQGGRSTWKQAM
jgi:hypothetical protein